jgi:hypothetical protein
MNTVSRIKFFLIWHTVFVSGLIFCAAVPLIVYYFFPPWLLAGSQFDIVLIADAIFLFSSLHLIFSFKSTENIQQQYYRKKLWRLVGIIIAALLLAVQGLIMFAGLPTAGAPGIMALGSPLGFFIIGFCSYIYLSLLIFKSHIYDISFLHTSFVKKVLPSLVVPALLLSYASIYMMHDRYLAHQEPAARREIFSRYNELSIAMARVPETPRVQSACGTGITVIPSNQFSQAISNDMSGLEISQLVFDIASNKCPAMHAALCNTFIYSAAKSTLDTDLILWDSSGHWSFYEKENLITGQGFAELQNRLSANNCHLVETHL